jgi:hypothetical protein
MKIGDKVRFLSETGGGRVAGFQGKTVVLVEDEDGFQIPTDIHDVVVVGDESYDTTHVVEMKQQQTKMNKATEVVEKEKEEDDDPSAKPFTFKAPVEERKGGDMLSAYLAFVPMDVKMLTTTRFESYIVNDCNYYLRYIYMTAEGANWQVRSGGEIEPNTQMFIEEFGKEDLDKLEHVCIQLIAYKREKSFLLKSPVDVQIRVDGIKFYKLHTFQENDFFEQPALIYPIIENDKAARPLVIDAKALKQQLLSKVSADNQPATEMPKKKDKDEPLVVDLHAGEILDSTNGLEPADILNYQLETFRNTMKLYEKRKGQKIVFIHGKGEGVLRHAIVNDLKYRFKQCQYQDASFQEYGYGATQVTIK